MIGRAATTVGVLALVAFAVTGCGPGDDVARARTTSPMAFVDAVTAAIDPEVWATIDADGLAGREGAWVDESGIVATVSYDSPLLVIAVFTPCL